MIIPDDVAAQVLDLVEQQALKNLERDERARGGSAAWATRCVAIAAECLGKRREQHLAEIAQVIERELGHARLH